MRLDDKTTNILFLDFFGDTCHRRSVDIWSRVVCNRNETNYQEMWTSLSLNLVVLRKQKSD
jgi:hypothetical protein